MNRKTLATQLTGCRPGPGRAFWTMVAVIAMIAILLPVVAARPALGVELPAGTTDWNAAPGLPPMQGPDTTSPDLNAHGIQPLACPDEVCVATTLRPELVAEIDPDPELGYSFAVYDLAGAGGLTDEAASINNHDSATWAPEAGLLQQGHVYAWNVIGDEEEAQDWGVFVVDVERHFDQAFDPFGPVSVGTSTGALVIDHPLGSYEDDVPLAVQYQTSDPTGREAGSTPFHVVSDGWVLSGSGLGDASWYELAFFGGGDVVIANSVDGTSLRYELDEDGSYQPPQVDGLDLGFMYPALEARSDGSYVMSGVDGAISTFSSAGLLVGFELPPREGAAAASFEVEWAGGLLRSVTDPQTGRTATFTYLGERDCRPGGGFDAGGPVPALCSVETFAGETINLYYLDGALSRIVNPGGAVTDFAYDASGHLVAVRDSLAADSIAAGVVADTDAAKWRVVYNGDGRVESVTSPEPSPGEAPTVRTYQYDDATTTIHENGVRHATVTIDPVDLRAMRMDTVHAEADFVRLYGEDNMPLGYIDERGLQTSWATDAAGNIVEAWGPAPHAWFGADGRPLAAHADAVPTTTVSHGAGAGMVAVFTDGMEIAGTRSAQILLDTDTIESLPNAVDPTHGWRMTAVGDMLLPIEGDAEWRFTTDGAADEDATVLLVNNVPVQPGEVVEVPGPEEIDPEGQAFDIWVVYVSATAPSAAAPAWFTIEHSTDGGDWTAVDLGAMTGQDLPDVTTMVDVFAAGQAPTAVTTSSTYADPLLALVGEYTESGQTTTMTYEPANPLADQHARLLAMTNAGGVTTSLDYWGATDTAAHPITGQSLPQYGRLSSIQIGDDVERGMLYDAAGRVIAYTADGAVTVAMTVDQRGRLDYVELRDDPVRTTEYFHGVGGDPRVTAATSVVDGEELTMITTVDLLGRVISHVDPWGTTTTSTHDAHGNLARETVRTATGAESSTTYVLDPANRLLSQVIVEAVDGSTYAASVTGYDQAGRMTGVDYSNGASVSIAYDDVNGMVAAHRWTDGDGNAWVDEVVRTTQSGRVLSHVLESPTGAAHFSYEYDTTGALTDAALTGTGSAPESTSWTYSYDAGARTQLTTTTAADVVTLDYAYGSTQEPVQVIETLTPHGGEAMVREIPLLYDGTDLVRFDTVELTYNAESLLVAAADEHTTIEVLRDAIGEILGQSVTVDGITTTMRFSGSLVLDEHGVPASEVISMPGGVTVVSDLTDGEAAWHVDTLAGDTWWAMDGSGSPVGEVTYYSPDGVLLSGPDADPTSIEGANGWRSAHGGMTLALDTSVAVFGARAYVPALGMFTTTDPIAGAGPTPYSYADNDPINLIDPTGNSSTGFDSWTDWGAQLLITIGLTIAIIIALKLGLPSVAAFLTLTLAGYLGFLSYEAFERGDYVAGVFYAFSAALVLVGGVYLGYKAAFAKKQVAALPSGGGSQTRLASQPPSPSISSSTSSRSVSQSVPVGSSTFSRQEHARQLARIEANLDYGGMLGGGAAASSSSTSVAVVIWGTLLGAAAGALFAFGLFSGLAYKSHE